MMAIELLKAKRAALREKARWYNRRNNDDGDGDISVRTWNLLRQCAQLTTAILILKHTTGGAI